MKIIALAPLLLTGCADLGLGSECEGDRPGCPSSSDCDQGMCFDNDLYACNEDTGEWEVTAICEAPWVAVEGVWLVEQQRACDGMPASLALSVAEDGSVTEAVDGEANASWGGASLDVSLDADWGGTTTRVRYQLRLSDGGWISGKGEVEDGSCVPRFDVRGERCPVGAEPCTVHDDGRHGVWCDDAVVYADDLSVHAYCAPGTDDEVCQVGGEGYPFAIAACPTSCGEITRYEFATTAAYEAFDPLSLCEP